VDMYWKVESREQLPFDGILHGTVGRVGTPQRYRSFDVTERQSADLPQCITGRHGRLPPDC